MSGETVRILREARKLVEKGWLQGYGSGRDGKYCAGAAIEVAARQDTAAWWPAKAVFCRTAPVHGEIHVWNDAPGRTQAEVLAAFDKAISLAESAP